MCVEKVPRVFAHTHWERIFVKTEKQSIYIMCEELFDSKTWAMKMEHEVKLNATEMSMIRWTCGFTLKERKKNSALRELLKLEPASLVIKKGRLDGLDMWNVRMD